MLKRRFKITWLIVITGACTIVWAQRNRPEANTVLVNQVKAHMRRYVGLANQGRTDVIAKEIYETPILMIPFESPQHRVQNSATDFRQEFDEHLSRLKSQDWKQFKVHRLDVRSVGKDLAFVDMHFVWLKTNGQAIGPAHRVASYVLSKKKHGWRIIAVMGNRKA